MYLLLIYQHLSFIYPCIYHLSIIYLYLSCMYYLSIIYLFIYRVSIVHLCSRERGLLSGAGSHNLGGWQPGSQLMRGDPGELMVRPHVPLGRPEKGVNSHPRQIWRQEETRASGREWTLSNPDFLYVLIQTECMRPTHTGGQSPLLSLLNQILISSSNTLADTHRITFDQISGPLVAQTS